MSQRRSAGHGDGGRRSAGHGDGGRRSAGHSDGGRRNAGHGDGETSGEVLATVMEEPAEKRWPR